MISPALFSSAREDWATPQDFFDTLNAEFHFTLDACANDQNAKCPAYYTKEQDGLAQPWMGTVWCNPPYGREIGAWIAKAYTSACIFGAVVVMLLPARTDTVWFHTWVYPYAEIRFIRGRLKFGGSKNSAPFPSMVAIFRPTKEDSKDHV